MPENGTEYVDSSETVRQDYVSRRNIWENDRCWERSRYTNQTYDNLQINKIVLYALCTPPVIVTLRD